jgi:menaquinone-dependent protoporphyrinogen oxidase
MAGILVVYATTNGSTREVAEAVAAALRSDVVDVVIAPAREVKAPVGDRDLVVVGGALYSGRWHRDAKRFLDRHRRELDTIPVAVFGMGPRRQDEEAWTRSRAQLERALARHAWLHPLAVTVFGGVDPPRRSGRPRRDVRDWDAIRTWSQDLARHLPAARLGR